MPANPTAFPQSQDIYGGMSLHDWFAGQRLTGISQHYHPDMAAKAAYKYADAMLAERERHD